jgi:hypothetical protein
MKMKSVPLALLAISILAGIVLTPTHASISVKMYARTDKAGYIPGDTGTLFITVRNDGTQSFAVKNISITYPWLAFITDHWDGNATTTGITQPLAQGQTYNTQYTFTVPTDGRASNAYGPNPGVILIDVGTDVGSSSTSTGTTYHTQSPIFYAIAAYQPFSLTSSLLSIVQIVLLGIAVVMLALVFMGIGKLSKK